MSIIFNNIELDDSIQLVSSADKIDILGKTVTANIVSSATIDGSSYKCSATGSITTTIPLAEKIDFITVQSNLALDSIKVFNGKTETISTTTTTLIHEKTQTTTLSLSDSKIIVEKSATEKWTTSNKPSSTTKITIAGETLETSEFKQILPVNKVMFNDTQVWPKTYHTVYSESITIPQKELLSGSASQIDDTSSGEARYYASETTNLTSYLKNKNKVRLTFYNKTTDGTSIESPVVELSLGESKTIVSASRFTITVNYKTNGQLVITAFGYALKAKLRIISAGYCTLQEIEQIL